MISRNILMLIISLIGLTFSQDPKSTEQSVQSYNSIIFDSNNSIRTGADNILSIHKLISSIENKLIGTSWFEEDRSFGKTGNAIARFAKYVFVDIPISFTLILFNHEYYGHGSRYREFDLGPIEYQFNSPPPYGEGGGYANTKTPDNYSLQKKIAIWHAGFDAHDLLNKRIYMQWLASGQTHYNENILYLWTWQDRFQYIQSFDELPTNVNGALNDPQGYIWFLNHNAGVENTDELIMDLNDLQKKDMINLINPFLWYSLFTQFKTYLFDGQTQASLPMIRVTNLSYLPSMRMTLTPFGPEYHLENYIKYKKLVSLVDISYGDQTFYNDWWGVGLNLKNIYRNKQFSFDLNLNTWNQPKLELNNKFSSETDNELGFAGSIRFYYDMNSLQIPLSVIAELGYKTSGFIQGYSLDNSPIFMLGLGLRT